MAKVSEVDRNTTDMSTQWWTGETWAKRASDMTPGFLTGCAVSNIINGLIKPKYRNLTKERFKKKNALRFVHAEGRPGAGQGQARGRPGAEARGRGQGQRPGAEARGRGQGQRAEARGRGQGQRPGAGQGQRPGAEARGRPGTGQEREKVTRNTLNQCLFSFSWALLDCEFTVAAKCLRTPLPKAII